MKSKVLNLGQNNPGDSTGWALSSWAAAESDWSSWRTRGIGGSSASGMTQDKGKEVFLQLGGLACTGESATQKGKFLQGMRERVFTMKVVNALEQERLRDFQGWTFQEFGWTRT